MKFSSTCTGNAALLGSCLLLNKQTRVPATCIHYTYIHELILVQVICVQMYGVGTDSTVRLKLIVSTGCGERERELRT